MRMIILHDVIEAINNSPLSEGWLVGGVVERGCGEYHGCRVEFHRW